MICSTQFRKIGHQKMVTLTMYFAGLVALNGVFCYVLYSAQERRAVFGMLTPEALRIFKALLLISYLVILILWGSLWDAMT